MAYYPTPSDDGWWSNDVVDHSRQVSVTSTSMPSSTSFQPSLHESSHPAGWQRPEPQTWTTWRQVAEQDYVTQENTMQRGFQSLPGVPVNNTKVATAAPKRPTMQTGCVSCLTRGIACDPRNPSCKLAMSADWNLNLDDEMDVDNVQTAVSNASLSLVRPDTKWRRSWRERHSLNFYVNYSAPQMAGLFDSAFWQRLVIQRSFQEPAILHALTAIGALHETILQRSFPDEKRKSQAMEFALGQCNRAIACLTKDSQRGAPPNTIVALTTCVLFTCFETLQGRTDSAVNHAFQGRRLLEASGRADVISMAPSDDYIEHIRPLVDRLEVQATALLEKGKKPEIDTSDKTGRLPQVERIFTLEHAHDTLHIAMNSIMRFMQGFHPTAPKDHIAVTMAEKYLRYAPWFQQWEYAFTVFLSEQRETISPRDLKRAMVLKANHLVGTMLAVIDQSAGPEAYDPYEGEFQAIVELSREVLATMPCPPLPTLHGDNAGNPFLCWSLWVTDPLWMAISRCRNSGIRQSAFVLLSQNPRQEGLWHSGPVAAEKKKVARTRGAVEEDDYEAPEEVLKAAPAANMKVRAEWLDLRAKLQHRPKADQTNSAKIKVENETPPPRYTSTCTGRCSIPNLESLKRAREDSNDPG